MSKKKRSSFKSRSYSQGANGKSFKIRKGCGRVFSKASEVGRLALLNNQDFLIEFKKRTSGNKDLDDAA